MLCIIFTTCTKTAQFQDTGVLWQQPSYEKIKRGVCSQQPVTANSITASAHRTANSRYNSPICEEIVTRNTCVPSAATIDILLRRNSLLQALPTSWIKGLLHVSGQLHSNTEAYKCWNNCQDACRNYSSGPNQHRQLKLKAGSHPQEVLKCLAKAKSAMAIQLRTDAQFRIWHGLIRYDLKCWHSKIQEGDGGSLCKNAGCAKAT